MSSVLRVACPHCLARLKLKSREILGRRVTCPKCRETFDALEEDEELFRPAELPPPEPSPPIISRKAPRRKKRSNRVPGGLGWFFAGSAVTAITAATFFVPWSSLVADINLNPFADTADTIMTLETPLVRELADLVEGAVNGGSVQDVAAKIKNLDDRVVDLYLRAVRVSPVSRERLDSISQKHMADMNDFVNRANTVSEGGRSERRVAASPADQQAIAEFKIAFNTVDFHLRCIHRTYSTIMEKPPAPQSKMGKTQREVVDSLREVVVLLSRVDSNSAALTTRSALEKYKERLDKLKRKIPEEMAGESHEKIAADLVFDRFAESIRTEIAQIGEIVAQRYNPGSDFQAAVSALAPFASRRMRTFPNSPAAGEPRRLAGPRTTIVQADAAPPSAPAALFPHGPALSVTPTPPASQTADKEQIHDDSTGPADPPFVPPNTSPDGFVPKCIREFGKDNVVFIGFAEADIPAREITRLLSQIQSDLGNVTTRCANNKWAIIAIASSEEIEALADKLHVGRIRRIDAENRRIFVALSAVVPPMSPSLRGTRTHRPMVFRNPRRFPGGKPTPPPSNLGPAPGPQPNALKSSGL